MVSAQKKEWLTLMERIAQGIVAVVGPHCEVVVHDFDDLEHSAVIIVGNISGRKPGAPVPDFDFVANSLDTNIPDQLNYRIQLGDREVQSSTIWLRDDTQKVIGALCINVDFGPIRQIQSILTGLLNTPQETSEPVIANTFARDLDDLLRNTVQQFLAEKQMNSVDALTLTDKMNLIEKVEKLGLFQMRGAAQRLADLLNVSRASIYNYRSGMQSKDPSPASAGNHSEF